MKIKPILENDFYHDGRGPELQRVIGKDRGVLLVGFEYFIPDDIYEKENLKYIELIGVEAYFQASDEVHGNICASKKSKAAIFEIESSKRLVSLNPRHLTECKYFQIMFYDEIYDVICKEIKAGVGQRP